MSKIAIRRVAPVIVLMTVAAFALVGGGTSAARPRGLVAQLTNASSAVVGTVRLIPTDDGKTAVRITASGLTPGFHGYHVHSVGVCDPQAADTAGNPSPFFSAGGHFNPDATMTHGSHAGDMPPLLVTADGTARMSFRTDRFQARDLLDADGSAVMLHAGADNLANIPGATSTGGERYHSHVDDIFGPDTATKATGDAGSRFACGVVTRFTG